MLIMCHVSSVKGHVICSQHKAWNDTIRMAMYIEQIMKPLHDKNGGKSLTWADNCGCHKTMHRSAYARARASNGPASTEHDGRSSSDRSCR